MARRDKGVSDRDLDQLSSLFRLLSDKTRLCILLRLAKGERSVKTLCGELRLPQPTVSHHLGLLRMNNVVGSRRLGKQIIYALNGHNLNGHNGSQDHSLMEFAVHHLAIQVKPRSH